MSLMINKNRKEKKKNNLIRVISTIVIFICLLCSGCYSSFGKKIIINPEKITSEKTIQVDIASLTEKQYEKIKNVKQADYWAFNSKVRDSLKNIKTYNITENQPIEIFLDNELWGKMQRAKDKYILFAADLPKKNIEHKKWLVIMPLERCYWFNFWSSRSLKLIITVNGFERSLFS